MFGAAATAGLRTWIFLAAIPEPQHKFVVLTLNKVCGGEAMFLSREFSDRGASHVAASLHGGGFLRWRFAGKGELGGVVRKNRHQGVLLFSLQASPI